MKVNQNLNPSLILLKIDHIRISYLNINTDLFELRSIKYINNDGCIGKIVNYGSLNNSEKIFEYRPLENTYFERNFFNGELTQYFKYIVDVNGNRTHFYQYDKEDKEVYHQRRNYDRNNLNIELFSQDEYGSELLLAQKYYYNDKKQLIKIEDFDDDGSIAYWDEIEYNTKCIFSQH